MKKLYSHIWEEPINFSSINRSILPNEKEETIKTLFPLIYRSCRYKQGSSSPLCIIEKLKDLGQSTIYGLSKICNTQSATVIKIVRKLEEKGYLKHTVVKGRGKYGAYLYRLTKLGEFAYYTIFSQRPISWIIDTMLENIENETVKETPVYHLVKRNSELLKNEVFRELLDYLFMKYVKSRIPKSIEDLFTIEDLDEHIIVDVLFIGSITPVVFSIVLDTLSYIETHTDNEISYFLKSSSLILSAISELSLIPIRVENTDLLPDFIEEIYSILKEVDESIVERIFRFSMDYLKYLIIKKNWNVVKGAIDTLFIMKQLAGYRPNKKEISEFRDLIKAADKYLNNILDKMDKLA